MYDNGDRHGHRVDLSYIAAWFRLCNFVSFLGLGIGDEPKCRSMYTFPGQELRAV